MLRPVRLRPLIPGLIGVLVCLRVLANAGPPDPTWMGGVWDDDDYDDVIIHITSSFVAAEIVPDCSVRPGTTLVWSAPPDVESVVTNPVVSRLLPRGPPRY